MIDGTLTAETYKDILEECLLPEISSCNVPMVFMQDNAAPCHNAKSVLQFFDDHAITTLDWPPQSPDLNPIENLWSIIKLKRSKRFGLPNTKNELISQVFEIWGEISEELKNNLADSIYNPCRRVGQVC